VFFYGRANTQRVKNTLDDKYKKKELTMRKIIIPLGIATFLLLTGFGVYHVARGKASIEQIDEGVISLDAVDGKTTEIEAA
jgi:hypothetical protein